MWAKYKKHKKIYANKYFQPVFHDHGDLKNAN
jgi:hypothetical protein